MLGNVREWTSTADAQDKQKHHTKGGSYLSERADINIGATVLSPVNSGANDLGFRCVK
jgi:formylglycine-generating enzyme required for sulfatase activity